MCLQKSKDTEIEYFEFYIKALPHTIETCQNLFRITFYESIFCLNYHVKE